MKKALSVMICVLFVISISNTVLAAGNWRKGKKVYKADCINCHKRGGEAKKLKLNKKTKAQWSEFCDSTQDNTHEELWDELSAKQKENLLKYLHKYSKDNKRSLPGCG